MRYLRYLALLAVLMVPLAFAQAQVGVAIGVGPGYEEGPPVCEYGYYDYYPYACAPYGYYGPQWFSGGVFIGAGPWYGRGWGAVAAGAEEAGAMVTAPTDAEVTGVVAMRTEALPEEAEVASMAADPAAAVSTVAAATLAEATLAEATVAEVTVAEATVADTGKNSRHGEVSTAGSTALPAISSLSTFSRRTRGADFSARP